MKMQLFLVVSLFISQLAWSLTSSKSDTINDFLYVEKTITLKPERGSKTTVRAIELANKKAIELNRLELIEYSERLRRRMLPVQTEAGFLFLREIPPKSSFKKMLILYSYTEVKKNMGKTAYYEFQGKPKTIVFFQSVPDWKWLDKLKAVVKDQMSKKADNIIAAIARIRYAALAEQEKTKNDPKTLYYLMTAQVKDASIIKLKEILTSKDPFERIQAAFVLAYLGDDNGKDELLKFAKAKSPTTALTKSNIEIFYIQAGLAILEIPIPEPLTKRTSGIPELDSVIKSYLSAN